MPYAAHFKDNPNCFVGLDTFDQNYGDPEYLICNTAVRRVSFAADLTSAFINFNRLYRFPHARIIDVTNRRAESDFQKLFDEPFWKVQRGDQSCVEQSPQGEYLFLLGVNREYALLFRDQVGIPVTATGKVYAAKMKQNESIILHLSHKGPFQAAASWAEVSQQGESRWGENTMTIGWEPEPPKPPNYSIGQKDDATCGLREYERCATDTYFQTLELRHPLKIVNGSLQQPLVARASGRTTRGGRLFPAADTVLIESGFAASDFWITDTSSLLEGSSISFSLKSASYVHSSRWRHGFDSDTRKFEFFTEIDGYSSTQPVAKNGTQTISLVEAPYYCWDVAHDDRSPSGRAPPSSHPAIELWLCDDKTRFQDWIWVSKSDGGHIENVGYSGYCVGVSSSTISDGIKLVLTDCLSVAQDGSPGSLLFNKTFLEESEVDPSHGIFFYDRNQGPFGFDPDGVTWDNASISDWFPRGQIPFDQTNISKMTVLLAGNSTVNIETRDCGPEGCPYKIPVCKSCSNRVFRWETGDDSLNAVNWNVTNDPSIDIPSMYWSGTIWDGWTVIIDQDTPVINRLIVRGTLMFDPNANVDMTLHAHYIAIDGGRIIMGNESDPISNSTSVTISLHGDRYLSTVRRNGAWERVYNFKRIDVNGNFSIYGQRVTTWRKLGAHAFSGNHTIRLADPAIDWQPGDVLTLSHTKHHGASKGNTRATDYEEYVIQNVTGNGYVVSLTKPLTTDYVGEVVEIPAVSSRNWTKVDLRCVVANNRRNARILGADTRTFDRISGVTAQQQGYGAQIRGRPERDVPKPGWSPTDPLYDTLGKETLPAGFIDIHFATFETCGKGFFLTPIQTWDGVNIPEAIRYTSEQSIIKIEGIRTVTPLVGSGKTIHNYFIDGIWNSGLRFTDNVFMGIAFKFGPIASATHVIENNAFFGNGAGTMCAGSTAYGVCPDMYMVELGHSGGELIVVNNVFHGAFTSAIQISRPCSAFGAFHANVALSSYMGVSIQGIGCGSLNIQSHRNSIGVIAGNVGSVSNIVAAENGFGLLPADDWDVKPQKFFTPNLDLHADLTKVEDSIFVGVLLDLQRLGFKPDCDDWTGVQYGFEEHWISFRDWNYTGIQRGAFGGKKGDRKVTVYYLKFRSFSASE